jgi:hypothetical protein
MKQVRESISDRNLKNNTCKIIMSKIKKNMIQIKSDMLKFV